jgi:hypothetical protein
MNKDGVEFDKLADFLEKQAEHRGYLSGYSDGLYKSNLVMNVIVIVIVLTWFVIVVFATIWQTILACGVS